MVERWHKKPEIGAWLRNFHLNYAQYPTSRIEEAKRRFTVYTDYLATNLRAQGMCSRIGYTGSVYQGVAVPSHNIDFDIVVIQPRDVSRHLTPEPRSPGYCSLKMTGEKAYEYRGLLDGEGYLLPNESVDKFYGVVQKVINEHGEMSRVVKLVDSGPSVQQDTYRKDRSGELMYSVDVVLAYEIEQEGKNIIYVAKPPKTESAQTRNAWRKSFSLDEKELFCGMDRDGGCRKMVLRILKAMLKKQSELEGLTSYNMKTALLHEVKEVSSWKASELVPRLIAVLDRLCKNLDAKVQPDYFVREINVLAKLSPGAMKNIKNRLRRIMHDEYDFKNTFM